MNHKSGGHSSHWLSVPSPSPTPQLPASNTPPPPEAPPILLPMTRRSVLQPPRSFDSHGKKITEKLCCEFVTAAAWKLCPWVFSSMVAPATVAALGSTAALRWTKAAADKCFKHGCEIVAARWKFKYGQRTVTNHTVERRGVTFHTCLHMTFLCVWVYLCVCGGQALTAD